MTTHHGKIKCFRDNKNFGFITDSSTGNDIYFRSHHLRGSLSGMLNSRELVGTFVTYELGKNAKGKAAQNICFDALAETRQVAEQQKRKQEPALDTFNIKADEDEILESVVTTAPKVALKDKISAAGSAVGSRMLTMTKIDDPKAAEIAKVRLTNFALMSVYNSKIGLSRLLDVIVYALDRSGDFLEKHVINLSNTKRPKLRKVESK